MKRNLVKILALSSIVLGLGACQPNKPTPTPTPEPPVPPVPPAPEVVSISEAFAQEADGSFTQAGKEVILENLCVYSNYGTTLIAGVPYAEGGQITDLRGIEIELPALPTWSANAQRQGTYAKITVQGILTDVNGRPVLKDASCEVKGEAMFNPATGQRDEENQTSDYSCAYWNAKQTTRDNFNKLLQTPSNSGALMEGNFQLATVPSGVTNNAESSFKVVFPGENINGDDPTNEHVINVRIPAGLSNGAVSFINSFFADKVKGDFITMNAISQFDNTKGGMGFLFENQWAPNYTTPMENPPVLLTSWATIQARYAGRFKGVEVPDLGCDDVAYSYSLEDAFSGSVIDLVGDDNAEYWLVDSEKAGAFRVTANAGSSHADEAFEAVKEKAAALEGFDLDEELSDEIADEFYYVAKEGEGNEAKVIAEIFITLEGSEVKITFAGNRATDAQVNTFAEAIDQYEAVIGRDVDEFESSLPELPAGAASALTGINMDWKGYEDIEGLGLIEFKPEFTEGTFVGDEAWQGAAEAYGASLEAAGFAPDYAIPSLQEFAGVYYNATSKEVVVLSFSYADDDSINGLVILAGAVLNAAKADAHLFNVSETSAWTTAMAYNYIWDALCTFFDAEDMIGNGATALMYGYLMPASKREQYQALFENYGFVPLCALSNSGNPVNDGAIWDYYYFLPTATAGTYVQILFEWEDETVESQGQQVAATGFIVRISTYTPGEGA